MKNDKSLKIGCVLMAAGNAVRFGENKLAAELDGKNLITRAIEAIPADSFDCVSVVTQYPIVMAQAEEAGFTPILNEHPEYGISHTIELGINSMKNCDALMFMVSDQPLLQQDSVRKEVEFYKQHSDSIVGMGHNGIRGNPCIFPSQYFGELMDLQEDSGGNTVIRKHEDKLLIYETNEKELTDIDCKADIHKIKSEG